MYIFTQERQSESVIVLQPLEYDEEGNPLPLLSFCVFSLLLSGPKLSVQ